MHFALVDDSRSLAWSDIGHRFQPFKHALTALGHRVSLLDAAEPVEQAPLIAGLGKEGNIIDLIASRRIFLSVRDLAPDVCVLPLRGGHAHGILMARACGEIRPDMRIFVVREEPMACLARRMDPYPDWLRPLVADALERVVLGRCDGLLGVGRRWVPETERLGITLPPAIDLPAELALSADLLVARGRSFERILYVGPFERAAGVVSFIDAIEQLDAAGLMKGRTLVFVGPIAEGSLSLGKQWLGLRAQGWSFPFRVVATASWKVALRELTVASALAFLPDAPSTVHRDLAGIDASILASGEEVAKREACLLPCLRHALGGGRSCGRPTGSVAAGNAAERLLAALPTRPPADDAPTVGLSVCIVHFDRPSLLGRAVESVLAQVGDACDLEILVVDNGSRLQESHQALTAIESHALVNVIRLGTARPVPAALNRVSQTASKDFLVFLDDDNVMAEGGVGALAKAAAAGLFDVIASNLEVFEDDREDPGPTVAEMSFIGPAASAGLFFNGFGDTSMAFRRSAFMAIGGFLETGGPYPVADWLLFARAQAAGLRIGVLQDPAFRYRRNVHKSETHWQKFDQHGARQKLLDVYGGAFDPGLVAKLAQGLLVDEG